MDKKVDSDAVQSMIRRLKDKVENAIRRKSLDTESIQSIVKITLYSLIQDETKFSSLVNIMNKHSDFREFVLRLKYDGNYCPFWINMQISDFLVRLGYNANLGDNGTTGDDKIKSIDTTSTSTYIFELCKKMQVIFNSENLNTFEQNCDMNLDIIIQDNILLLEKYKKAQITSIL